MNLQFNVQRYQLEYVAQASGQFPLYTGSMWRGAFGHALKRTACITRLPSCSTCLLQHQCVYSQIFETPAGREPLLSKINHAPHPYIIEPLSTSGQRFEVGDSLTVGLTLVGQANESLPYLIHAFTQLGALGLGKAQARVQLQAVYQELTLGQTDWQLIYQSSQCLSVLKRTISMVPPIPQQVKLIWLTPFRAKYQEQLVIPSRFQPTVVLMGLVRRLSLLAAYWDQPMTAIESQLASFAAASEAIVMTEGALYWQEWTRFSNRQQRPVQMDGLMGSVVLSGAGLAECWEWLWWGQWLHVGKGTVMGLGQYRLEVC
jgi:hypothetical protein